MKPYDIVVLLKILPLEEDWEINDLAAPLFLSESKIRTAVERLTFCGLLSYSGGIVMRRSLYKFLVYGMKYAFPTMVGEKVTGIDTSHSSPILKKHFFFDQHYVWPSDDGDIIGNAIKPLFDNQVLAALNDRSLYDKLALIDAIRIGRVRERNKAVELLKQLILYQP